MRKTKEKESKNIKNGRKWKIWRAESVCTTVWKKLL